MWYDNFRNARILIHQEIGNKGISHNKFWHGHYDSGTGQVHLRWGRLGTKGQSKTKDFGDEDSAAHFLDNKYREKSRKGYSGQIDGKILDQAALDRLHTEAAIVGVGNKCTGFQWMEQIGTEDNPNFKKITEDRLYDPACDPAIFVELETKKAYDGMNTFALVFSGNGTYHVDGRGGSFSHLRLVKDDDPLIKMIEKVEESLGRTLSGV